MIYLDYNATTPVNEEAMSSMLPFFSDTFSNPSSQHTPGKTSKEAIEKNRSLTANAIGAALNSEIIFTSGGSEANNIAIQGMALTYHEKNSSPGHIISNRIEHSCVLNTLKHLEKHGWEITYLDVDKNGLIAPEAVKTAIKKNTCLVSIMMANNETGVVQDLTAIGNIAHKAGVLVHTDAVQAVGKVPVNVQNLGVDLLSLSAHKFYGPKGIGALYIKNRLNLKPILFGGGQEKSLKPGTENVPGIVGLGSAIVQAVDSLQKNSELAEKHISILKKGILDNISDVRINGNSEIMLPNTLNVSFAGIDAISLHSELDAKGIYVGTGAACSSSAPEVSHVLKGMNVPPEYAFSAIRFSVGRATTQYDIQDTLQTVIETVSELRGEKNNGCCCCKGCC